MMAVKKNISIFVFFIFCILLIFKSTFQQVKVHHPIFGVSRKIEVRFGEFMLPKIFHIKDGYPFLFISAKFARINLSSDDAHLFEPYGKSFSLDREPINYSSQEGFYNNKKSELRLSGSVLVQESDSELRANKVIYKMKRDEVLGDGKVFLKGLLPKTKDKIFITGNKFSYFPKRKITSFKEKVVGEIRRREAYREPINFEAEVLDYYFKENRINLTGDVIFRRKPFSASARNGQFILSDKNKLNYFVLNDDVKLREQRDFQRRAFAEKMEGFPDEGRFILTGYPRVFQENEIIKGIKIIVRENSSVVEVEEANTTLKLQKAYDGKNLFKDR